MSEDAPPPEPPGGAAAEPIDPAADTIPARATVASAPLPPPLPLPLELGPCARLGRYEIAGRLGAGAMGIVLEARDTELDRTVALKVVRPRGDDLAAAQARLRREAQAMARLSHPNVAAVFDIGTVGEQLFIAMELVRGGTLRDHVGTHRPWRDQLRALIDAGRGLAAAHEAGVIHRDFKPDNVLVHADGSVRVADFGLAREARGPEGADLADAAAAPEPQAPPRTAGLAGTLAYMAPESFEGAADAATDQFAFAVTAFELLEGARPFELGRAIHPGGSPDLIEACLRALREGRRRPWRRRELPARVRAAIDRGLALDPAARWPSIGALCDAIAPRRSRARAWAVAPVLAAAAAAAAVAIAAVARRAPAPAPRPPPTFTEAARQQLTFSGEASLPRLSPDGRWLAYGLGYDRRAVAVQDLTTGRSRVVYRDAPASNVRWSHDGARLLIATSAGNVVIDRDGTRRAHFPGCALSAWSPDGARVVTACAPADAGLTFVELATRARRHVALALDAAWVTGLDWSPRDRLAVLTQGRAGHRLWTARPDGAKLRAVAADAESAEVSLLGWSRDGASIFYKRVRDQVAELVQLELDPRAGVGGRATVLLTTHASDRAFSIAGDARAVVYAREESATNLVRWSAGGAPRALTADTRDKAALARSRDGRRIAYAAGAGGRRQIFVGTDGARAAPLPGVTADIRELAWSPDGARLAYAALRDGAVELWTVDVASGEARRLAHAPTEGELAWVTPGELLHLPPDDRGYRVLSLATGHERALSDRLPRGWMSSAERSPDGRRVALAVDATPDGGVWAVALDGGDARRLYAEPLTPIGWSEDGAWVHVQGHGAAPATYAIAASGSGEIRPLLAARRPVAGKIRILPGERAALALEVAWQSDVWRISLDRAPLPIAFAPLEPLPEPHALPAPAHGDFARGLVGRAPDGWSPGPYGGTAEATDRCLGASGRCAVVANGGWLEQRIAAGAYRGKRIRVRARTHAAGGSALALWLETPAERARVAVATAPAATGWQAVELVAEVRPDARQLIVKLEAAAASTALFDDVSLEVVEP